MIEVCGAHGFPRPEAIVEATLEFLKLDNASTDGTRIVRAVLSNQKSRVATHSENRA